MGENDVNQTISEPNAVNQTVSEPNAVIQPAVEPNTANQSSSETKVSEPNANVAEPKVSEPKTSEPKTSESNVNVLKVINALSQNNSLISQSAKSKLTGAFDADISVLNEGPLTFKGKVTGFALIVNTFNVRTLKRSINDIKYVEVTKDEQLFANNLPNSCYRTRWTVQMGDGKLGSCTAMRGSDVIEYGNDVTVTLSKSSFNNVNFVKSVINKK